MGKLVLICVLLVLSEWGAQSFQLDAFFGRNSSSDVSFLESMSHLESVYGVAAAAIPPNALMVGLTLVQGAAAKLAGTLSLSLSRFFYFNASFHCVDLIYFGVVSLFNACFRVSLIMRFALVQNFYGNTVYVYCLLIVCFSFSLLFYAIYAEFI